MPAEPVVAVVVAAGSGVRLGGAVPKPLRLIAGRAVVVHAVHRLLAGGVDQVVVVVPAARQADFDQVLSAAFPLRLWRTVPGGAERQVSVRRGLAAIEQDPALVTSAVVLIHDAARPLVPAEVVSRVIDKVRSGAVAVIPVVAVTDTIRQLGVDTAPSAAHSAEHSVVLDRTTLRSVQTPQGFDRITITAAHALAARDGVTFTDDAMACEHAGRRVALVLGARESHKITEPADLAWAEAMLAGDVVHDVVHERVHDHLATD